MYAKSSGKKFKFDRKSTTNMQNIFGNVSRVFLDAEEYASNDVVSKDGDWSGVRMLVEFDNGKYVEMSNSEWANFKTGVGVEVE